MSHRKEQQPDRRAKRTKETPKKAPLSGSIPNRSMAALAKYALHVQRDASHEDGAGPLSPEIASDIERSTGGGSALPDQTKSEMEGFLGTDLSGVRVHHDNEADRLSKSVQAKAFTTGSNVFFRSGAYNPSSTTGRELLAHELTHVAQQGRTGPQAEAGTISHPSDPLEREADATAAAFVARSTSALSTAGTPPGSGPLQPPTGSKGEVQRSSAAMGEGGQSWIRVGDRGPEVEAVRDTLNAVGTAGTPLPAGNRYDSAMVAVLKQFQADEGLKPDAVIGPLTHEALDRHRTTTAETVTAGTDHIGSADRPTDAELTGIDSSLHPTSSGPSGVPQDWDGRADPAKRQELRDELMVALQDHLDEVTPNLIEMEDAKAAGQVLSLDDQEGAGLAAKNSVDGVFGDLASNAVLTRSQERARGAFRFEAGVNLLDASDPSVRQPDPVDLSEWMAETDEDASQAQSNHNFDKNRDTQGEPAFLQSVLTDFRATGSNLASLRRYDLFGFFFAVSGPKVLSQIALTDSPGFSATPASPGGMSEAERLNRWNTWQTLVHEYIHTLAHPNFNASHGGNRILIEGFCELFTRAVLVGANAIDDAQSDANPSVRHTVEGGDVPDFDAKFVTDYSAGEYRGYLKRADEIVAEVGIDAAQAAFFLGHVELIGLVPGGSDDVIDTSDPAQARHLGPERVIVPDVILSVGSLSILTGVPEAELLAANPSLVAGDPLPAEAHTDGVVAPGTSHHRVLQVRSRGQQATETKEDIAAQHGITVAALVRANPGLNHRQPREGTWILIPKH